MPLWYLAVSRNRFFYAALWTSLGPPSFFAGRVSAEFWAPEEFWMKTIVCILSLFAVAACLNAQTTTGGISGTVSDSVGAAVPSARVTMTKTDTNEVRTTSTDASGSFEFTAVPPGAYAVQVSQP